MKKIMILGGHGFMGKNLNLVLDKNKYQIINASRRTKCDASNLDLLMCTIRDVAPDVIIMAAANVGSISYVSKYAANVVHDNTLMYVNLYRAVAEINPKIQIINPISNCSYPGIIDIQNEECWWDGAIHESVEAYGTPKKIGYIISRCYQRQHGINTVNLIVPNAYGPHDYLDEQRTHAMNGIIMRMIKSKMSGQQEFSVWGSGTPIREWVYMADVARLIAKILDDDITYLPNPLNIGQQHGISINDSVDIIKRLLDYPVTVKQDLSKPDGAPVKILGNALFQQHFPDFDFTDYHTGISETINYYTKLL
jgi:GDP-L-fucose synthase